MSTPRDDLNALYAHLAGKFERQKRHPNGYEGRKRNGYLREYYNKPENIGKRRAGKIRDKDKARAQAGSFKRRKWTLVELEALLLPLTCRELAYILGRGLASVELKVRDLRRMMLGELDATGPNAEFIKKYSLSPETFRAYSVDGVKSSSWRVKECST